ncbi:YbaB/EbfC family nucleoid-associated protein [candidate division WOR-3 bacterium]|nr:YbaB/EbfC family nucleoid-associated protein [candidate division WOR-3 bacterium]
MLNDLFKKVDELKNKINSINEELEKETIESIIGGGLINISANGKGDIKSINIDDSLLKIEKKEILQGLLISCIQSIQEKVKNKTEEKMRQFPIDIPGFPFVK